MCIAFPGKIISIDGDNTAAVDIGGTRHNVSLDLIDEELEPGDYVVSHAGFAIHKVNAETAREDLAVLKELFADDLH